MWMFQSLIVCKVDLMHFLLENFVLQTQTDLQVLQSAQDGDGNVWPRDLLRIPGRKVWSVPRLGAVKGKAV